MILSVGPVLELRKIRVYRRKGVTPRYNTIYFRTLKDVIRETTLSDLSDQNGPQI